MVLGGGLSGVAAARALQESGAKYLLLERCPGLGGLTRTARVGDYCFDYTGHFLHLRRYASPSQIPFAQLKDNEWKVVARRSACYVAGKMITAPIQFHLGELPPAVLEKCLKSYEERPRSEGPGETNFRDYIIRNFGSALADLFLIPQNEKTFAISLDRLCMNAVKRFFPAADDAAIRRGVIGNPLVATGYNSSFWYPKTGGIEALVRGFSHGLDQVVENQEIGSINLATRTIRTVAGLETDWDALLTSIPLPAFCRLTGDPTLVDAARQLTHSATVTVNIGLRGHVAEPLQDRHWVYVPDRSLPIYRVGVYSNISEGTCAPGHAALYAEVGMPADRIAELDLLKVQDEVLSCLGQIGWLDQSAVECVVTHVLKCAYVHHTPAAEELVGQVFDRLSQAQVFPIGRYGRWDYTSMEDSIDDGLSTAAKMLE